MPNRAASFRSPVGAEERIREGSDGTIVVDVPNKTNQMKTIWLVVFRKNPSEK